MKQQVRPYQVAGFGATILALPPGAEILGAGESNGQLCVFALEPVQWEGMPVQRRLEIVPPWSAFEAGRLAYVGSVPRYGGPVHVFIEREERNC